MNTEKSTAASRYRSTYKSIRNSKMLSYSLAIFFFAMAVGAFMESNGEQNLPMFFVWAGACVGSLISVRKIKRREEDVKLLEQVDGSEYLSNRTAKAGSVKVNLEPSVEVDVLIAELEEAIKRKHGIK